jgi:hypothetical protein
MLFTPHQGSFPPSAPIVEEQVGAALPVQVVAYLERHAYGDGQYNSFLF